jgi:hypothetical protein
VGEGTAAGVDVTADMVELMLNLHEVQAGPVSLHPLTGLPGGHVLLACNVFEGSAASIIGGRAAGRGASSTLGQSAGFKLVTLPPGFESCATRALGVQVALAGLMAPCRSTPPRQQQQELVKQQRQQRQQQQQL